MSEVESHPPVTERPAEADREIAVTVRWDAGAESRPLTLSSLPASDPAAVKVIAELVPQSGGSTFVTLPATHQLWICDRQNPGCETAWPGGGERGHDGMPCCIQVDEPPPEVRDWGPGIWIGQSMAGPGSAHGVSGLAAASRASDFMDIFWVAENGNVMHRPYVGHWVNADTVGSGASPHGGMAALSRRPDHVEVWWIGANGSVGDWWWEGAGHNREMAHPGSASPHGGMAAVSRDQDQAEVWWVTTGGGIQHRWYDNDAGTWHGREFAPEGSAHPRSRIAAVSRQADHMEVFWVASDLHVMHAWWSDGEGWNTGQLAGTGSAAPGGGLSVVSRAEDHMEVWWVTPDGSIQDRVWFEDHDWAPVALGARGSDDVVPIADAGIRGGAFAPPGSASPNAGVAAIHRGDNLMEVWWVSPDGSVQDRWFDGSQWHTFPNGAPLAGPGSASVNTGIAAISRYWSRMEVWWIGMDGSVQDRWFW